MVLLKLLDRTSQIRFFDLYVLSIHIQEMILMKLLDCTRRIRFFLFVCVIEPYSIFDFNEIARSHTSNSIFFYL